MKDEKTFIKKRGAKCFTKQRVLKKIFRCVLTLEIHFNQPKWTERCKWECLEQ